MSYQKMARIALSFMVMIAPLSAVAFGQSSAETMDATLCDLVKTPTRYAGKFVRVRATIVSAFEASSLATDPPDQTCSYRIWLAGAGEDHSITATPGAVEYADVRSSNEARLPNRLHWHPIPKLELLKDAAYNEFDRYLSEVYRPADPKILCMGCSLYTVTATITGWFDYAKGLLRVVRDRDKKVLDIGSFRFGHLNQWNSQLTLISVSDVVAKPRYSFVTGKAK